VQIRLTGLFRASFPNLAFISYVVELRSMLMGCRTVLDLGCGEASPLRFLKVARSVGVDGYGAAIDAARLKGTHDELYRFDVRAIRDKYPTRSFCCCVALDLIEHLPKDDGYRLIQDMERLASRRVVIFTPNGFIPQLSKDGDLQEHLSGWTVDEFRSLGFAVIGMYGVKSLRGETHNLRHRPKLFWGVVSALTHFLYTRRHPEKAAAILAVKGMA